MEWYSSGPSQYGSYPQYDQHMATSSGASYGTFEDEAPLLEGRLPEPHVAIFRTEITGDHSAAGPSTPPPCTSYLQSLELTFPPS